MYLSQHKNNLEVTAVGKGKSRLCVRLSGNSKGKTLKSMASAIMFALIETHCRYMPNPDACDPSAEQNAPNLQTTGKVF